ncbi:amidohydrolase family protein [Vallitaleaceae bacterium 9-2]
MKKGLGVLSLIIVCVFFYALIFQKDEKIEYSELEYRKLDIAQNKKYLLKNATIITMENEEDVFKGSILVSNGIITFIGQDKHINYPKDVEIIDCTDKYILPGFADMHVHANEVQTHQRFLAYGVTLVRNMQGSKVHLDRRESIKKGKLLGPEMFVGTPLFDGPDPMWPRDSIVLKQVDEVLPAIEMVIDEGYDFIKIYNNLSRDVFDEVMRIAEVKGILVAGHVPYKISAEYAAQKGLWSSEHLYGHGIEYNKVDKLIESIQEIIDTDMWICPTPMVHDTNDFERYVETSMSMEKALQYMKAFHNQGGKIVTGTDEYSHAIPAGSSLHETMKYMEGAGFTPYEILETVTINPARMLAIQDRVGTIKLNNDADLLIVDNNPLDNIENAMEIYAVMTKGRYLNQEWIKKTRKKLLK